VVRGVQECLFISHFYYDVNSNTNTNRYIAVEILKNAVVAVVDHHAGLNGNVPRNRRPVLPPIYVDVNTSKTSTDINIIDSGGGISSIEDSMSYCFTTGKSLAGNELSGAGIGMPMVRAYAEYFGGSMGHVNTEDGSNVSIRLLHEEDSTEQVHEGE
jgi:nitrogen-specific signal transduction histidine kinase